MFPRDEIHTYTDFEATGSNIPKKAAQQLADADPAGGRECNPPLPVELPKKEGIKPEPPGSIARGRYA